MCCIHCLCMVELAYNPIACQLARFLDLCRDPRDSIRVSHCYDSIGSFDKCLINLEFVLANPHLYVTVDFLRSTLTTTNNQIKSNFVFFYVSLCHKKIKNKFWPKWQEFHVKHSYYNVIWFTNTEWFIGIPCVSCWSQTTDN